MFKPRKIESRTDWVDPDGIKIYTISAFDQPVDIEAYAARLQEAKRTRQVDWRATPAFAICHDGASARYLVLAWWGNDNEMFTSVSVQMASATAWVEDPGRFSFCLWDLEVMWHERNMFVELMYGATPSLEAYRAGRFVAA
ncbi:hypothetical protein ACXU4B_06855 [Dyella soli]|uniref:Uncharacterized protein n=1 Tax=Dyella soli TaxID=522319 RepID=A0A4R0YP21_9GAMM|nr:hypothetical protein [Dyella soli]TCI10699.1 hypothetical protein EZM97_17755 [Dyella soli]